MPKCICRFKELRRFGIGRDLAAGPILRNAGLTELRNSQK